MQNLLHLPVVILTLGLWMLCTTVVSAQLLPTPGCQPLIELEDADMLGIDLATMPDLTTAVSDAAALAGTMPESGIQMPEDGSCVGVRGFIKSGIVPDAKLADTDTYLLSPVSEIPFLLMLIPDDSDATFLLVVVDAVTGAFISDCSMFLKGCRVPTTGSTSVSLIISAIDAGNYKVLVRSGDKP